MNPSSYPHSSRPTFCGHSLREDASGNWYVADRHVSDEVRAKLKERGFTLSNGAWRVPTERVTEKTICGRRMLVLGPE